MEGRGAGGGVGAPAAAMRAAVEGPEVGVVVVTDDCFCREVGVDRKGGKVVSVTSSCTERVDAACRKSVPQKRSTGSIQTAYKQYGLMSRVFGA